MPEGKGDPSATNNPFHEEKGLEGDAKKRKPKISQESNPVTGDVSSRAYKHVFQDDEVAQTFRDMTPYFSPNQRRVRRIVKIITMTWSLLPELPEVSQEKGALPLGAQEKGNETDAERKERKRAVSRIEHNRATYLHDKEEREKQVKDRSYPLMLLTCSTDARAQSHSRRDARSYTRYYSLRSFAGHLSKEVIGVDCPLRGLAGQNGVDVAAPEGL